VGEGGRYADKYVVWSGDQGWLQGTGKGLGIQGEYFGIASYDIAQKEIKSSKTSTQTSNHATLLPSTSDPTAHTISTILFGKAKQTRHQRCSRGRCVRIEVVKGGCWGYWRWGGGEVKGRRYWRSKALFE